MRSTRPGGIRTTGSVNFDVHGRRSRMQCTRVAGRFWHHFEKRPACLPRHSAVAHLFLDDVAHRISHRRIDVALSAPQLHL